MFWANLWVDRRKARAAAPALTVETADYMITNNLRERRFIAGSVISIENSGIRLPCEVGLAYFPNI